MELITLSLSLWPMGARTRPSGSGSIPTTKRFRRPYLPLHGPSRSLSVFGKAQTLVKTATTTEPIQHALPGHGWTLKKPRQWILATWGRRFG